MFLVCQRTKRGFQRFKKVCNEFHAKEVASSSKRRACAGACAFVVFGVSCTKQVSWAPVHVHQCTYLQTHHSQKAHMRSCMRNLFISVGGRGWGGLTILYRALVAGVGAYFQYEENRVVVWDFFDFLTGVGVYVSKRVCICTHTHTLHVGHSNVSPVLGMRHLESPKNPDGLNLRTHISVYVSQYTRVYTRWAKEWDLGLTTFSIFPYVSFRKSKAKDVDVIPKLESVCISAT